MTYPRRLIDMTEAELAALVAETVRAAVASAAPTSDPAPAFVTPAGAAEHFGCTPQTIRNWIRRGAPCRRLGGRALRVSVVELEAWHAGRPGVPQDP